MMHRYGCMFDIVLWMLLMTSDLQYLPCLLQTLKDEAEIENKNNIYIKYGTLGCILYNSSFKKQGINYTERIR